MGEYSTSGIGQKIVINVCDGTNLGYVTDIEFETREGRIVALIVGDCAPLGLGKDEVIRVPWHKIRCFGEDAILVEICLDECKCSVCNEKERKRKKKGIF